MTPGKRTVRLMGSRGRVKRRLLSTGYSSFSKNVGHETLGIIYKDGNKFGPREVKGNVRGIGSTDIVTGEKKGVVWLQ
jgi:hypothetical protein